MGKINDKYVINGVKATQKLVFGEKMLKMAHFDVTRRNSITLELESASIVMLDIIPLIRG